MVEFPTTFESIGAEGIAKKVSELIENACGR